MNQYPRNDHFAGMRHAQYREMARRTTRPGTPERAAAMAEAERKSGKAAARRIGR